MTTLTLMPYEIPAADLGAENPLPAFRDRNPDSTFDLDPSVPPEDRKHMGWQTAFRVLPHRMQDGYTRKKKPRAFRSLVLENEWLKATFLPELGGRMVSLISKREQRELLDKNPVFQPANLALRNAWFSGGVEWNTCQLGHYYLTCSPVFAARVTAPDGTPVLRLYEWDRVKCFPWQIDFYLPSDSALLFARVRLVNPHDDELAMYWWTNVAVPEKAESRVLFPAATALGFCENRKIGLVYLPNVLGVDASYTTNIEFAQEMFARIPDGQRRWMAHLDADGKGFFEVSTDRLRGRKMFCWGMNQGGRRWQEFLSVPGQAYIEIQAGLAPTQLESVPMPARSEWAWTEAFGLLEADARTVHGPDWGAAWRSGDAAIERVLPRAKHEALHEYLANVAQSAPDKILSRGSGWGALERRRLAKHGIEDRIPRELAFTDSDLGPDQAQWLELLDTGALPERPPDQDPGPEMVQPEWRNLLETAVRAGRGNHWLSWLHLGIMRYEAFDADGAREAWERSVSFVRNSWALRNLAALEQQAHGIKAGQALLGQAWETGPVNTPLAVEYATAMLANEDYEAMGVWIRNLPHEIRGHERIRILEAQAALRTGHVEGLDRLFDHEFATIREGEITLTDLWFEWHERRLAAKDGVPIDDALRRRVRHECPPPRHIDFRMIKDIE